MSKELKNKIVTQRRLHMGGVSYTEVIEFASDYKVEDLDAIESIPVQITGIYVKDVEVDNATTR
jgi:hypothetical protein